MSVLVLVVIRDLLRMDDIAINATGKFRKKEERLKDIMSETKNA